MSITEDVKKLLTGTVDEKLEIIERRTVERLRFLLGVEEVPEEFEYISYEVTLKRFNRVGNEGMASYSQEGLSMTFPDSDFDEYAAEIAEYRKKNDTNKKNNESAARFY
ncbi:phage head-tail connector protein [Candidatus Enterococcus ferrettii]|uniref:Phage head-tail connector protein n=1 Tax=Candidatus Enterococcus ferrettii TaxID=2815324 RepID=A0ABV0EI21_9ENTE|nr:phage head-tail connector protein [Enterococcus sp. 665A]MBO1341892.1 phage head-tail connector protein [Enterococcus sp. 665A]